jgi:N,N-dimethylformamidase
MMRGAAGFEIDRYDHELGSPPNTIILATATGFSDSYQHVIEEVGMMNAGQGGTVNKRVRAEMTFMETGNGGAVFSASSIAWSGSLSHNGYENNVSRITANVLRRFAADGPLKLD